MENNDRNLTRWVEERMAALEASDFAPDSRAARARVEARRRQFNTVRRRWFWTALAAAGVCLAVLAAPTRCIAASSSPCVQPVASRLWDSVFRKPEPPITLIQNPAPTAVPTPATEIALTPAAKPAPGPAASPAAARSPAPAPQNPLSPPGFKWTGSPMAPIICEIYSDFQCPHCAAVFQEILPQFEAQYVQTGKVRLLHRDFPIAAHPYAKLAARYADAAGIEGVYDLVARQLFHTQPLWSKDGDIESQLAPVLSPDVLHKIHDRVQHPAALDAMIDADLRIAAQDHIDRTPSLIVVFGGKRQVFAGFSQLELLQQYLDELGK